MTTAYDPVLFGDGPLQAMEGHRAFVERTKENSARLASATAAIVSHGDGEFLIQDPVLFGCVFTEQPTVAYGYLLDDEELPDDVPLPRASGFVRKWVRNADGYFTGAHVALTVDTTRVVAQAPAVVPPPAPLAFSDNFNRPDSPLIGNGWTQYGGDFFITLGRAAAGDSSPYRSWLMRPFGHVSSSVQADLRSPNGGSPSVLLWSTSAGQELAGYCLMVNTVSTTTNCALLRNGLVVKSGRVGTAGTAIGNVSQRLRLEAVNNGTTVTVKAYVNGVLAMEFSESATTRPTGTWIGAGNYAKSGYIYMDNFIAGEIVIENDVETSAAAEEVDDVPVFEIEHNFTFTGIAAKELPDEVLGATDDVLGAESTA